MSKLAQIDYDAEWNAKITGKMFEFYKKAKEEDNKYLIKAFLTSLHLSNSNLKYTKDQVLTIIKDAKDMFQSDKIEDIEEENERTNTNITILQVDIFLKNIFLQCKRFKNCLHFFFSFFFL